MFGFNGKIADVSKNVLEMLDDGVIIFDKHFNVVFFNEKAEKIFGWKANEIMGESLKIFIPERFHMQHDVFVDEFSKEHASSKKMGERTRKIYARHMEGYEFPTNITIMKSDAVGVYFIAIIRDNDISTRDEKELLRIAATDPLTGVLNKNEFLSVAEKECSRSKRYTRPFSVAILKLDNYTKINDSYSYSAGDRALQSITNICCNTLRNVDIFGRWSDCEFAILLPETKVDGASIISRRLVEIVSDAPFEWENNDINITISIGVAGYDDRKTLLEEAMRHATIAMDAAYDRGGNSVETYQQ